MAHCDEYLELISASLDGALSPEEQEALTAHLASCPECQRLFDDLLSLRAALRDLPPVEVPAGLKDRVMDAVAAEAEKTKVVPFAPKRAPRHWQRWLASAAALALVVMGTWSWKPWESAADRPRSAESAAGRGSSVPDSGSASAGTADAAAPARQPSSLSVPAEAQPAEAQPAAAPELTDPIFTNASAPAAEGANAPTEKIAVHSAKEVPASDGAASPQGAAPAENGDISLPLESPAVYGFTSTEQAPEVSTTVDLPSLRSTPAESGESQPTAEPRLFSIGPTSYVPFDNGELELKQSVTSQADAVNVLVGYIYEFVGEVELVEDGLNMNYTVNSPTGVSGVVACVGEDEEVYFLNYTDDLSPDVLNYSVNKQTSEVTLLAQPPEPEPTAEPIVEPTVEPIVEPTAEPTPAG